MQKLVRDRVSLAFHDNEGSGDVIMLVHGWGCDHTTLWKQQTFFAKTHRVINVELRGHGESSAPDQVYSVEQYSDDLVWLLAQLGIDRASFIGHSMGGAVALEAAHQNPKAVNAVAMIDMVFDAPAEVHQLLAPMLPAISGVLFQEAYRRIMRALSVTSDLAEVDGLLCSLPRAPQHVLLSSLQQHMEVHDMASAATQCAIPVAYIGASRPLANMSALKRLIPDLFTGQVLGAGHFAPWVAPEQVNAQLAQFLRLAGLASPAMQTCSQ